MLHKTYVKIKELFDVNHGYASSLFLRDNGITMIQISKLIEEEVISRITHGIYWWKEQNVRPEGHKYFETAMMNPKSVICGESACYLHGLLDEEPEILTIATVRTDRAKMKIDFPIKRHYFSDLEYDWSVEEVKTPYGSYKLYGLDRSVCDCIRLYNRTNPELINKIVEKYQLREDKNYDALIEYATKSRISNIAKRYLGLID